MIASGPPSTTMRTLSPIQSCADMRESENYRPTRPQTAFAQTYDDDTHTAATDGQPETHALKEIAGFDHCSPAGTECSAFFLGDVCFSDTAGGAVTKSHPRRTSRETERPQHPMMSKPRRRSRCRSSPPTALGEQLAVRSPMYSVVSCISMMVLRMMCKPIAALGASSAPDANRGNRRIG